MRITTREILGTQRYSKTIHDDSQPVVIETAAGSWRVQESNGGGLSLRLVEGTISVRPCTANGIDVEVTA